MLPTDITASSASPLDLADLQALLLEWLRSPDLETSQRYLQAHPELLADAAEQLLETLKHAQREEQARTLISTYRARLQEARAQGVEAAYQRFLAPEQEAPLSEQEKEDLLLQLEEWINTPDWKRAQAYLEAHPRLLTSAAETILARQYQTQQVDKAKAPMLQHQSLLRTAREQGIAAAYRSHLNPDLLDGEAIQMMQLYQTRGQVAALNRALSYWQEALILTPPHSPDRPMYLNNLGTGLHNRYARTGDLADLEAAIQAYEQAIQATPPDSPDHPGRLSNLGNGLSDRYARTGDLADLEAAIQAYEQAVQATPPDSPDRPMYLSHLGNRLSDRYARTGDLADLEAAIQAYEQAVQATSPDYPDHPTYLSNLGNGLSNRYERTGELADLEATIQAYEQAVQATSPDSPDHPGRLNNLGTGLRNRYRRTGELADLEAAIQAYEQAVQATPPDSPDHSGHLSNLGTGLSDRYARTGELADLEAAIQAYEQAVQATSPDSPDHPGRLNNLGTGLRNRYACTGELADLEAAIITWERAWSVPLLHISSLPVAYQLGQQRQSTDLAASLVTAYQERATRYHPTGPGVRRALEIVEGSKSRLLTQLVGRGPLPTPAGLLPQSAEREQLLLTQLTDLDIRELASHAQPASTQEETSRLDRLWQRQAALSELEHLWRGMARLGPEGKEYAALRRGEAPTWRDLTRLVKQIEPATMLLSFFTTAERALLFLLRSGWRTPRVVEVPLNETGWDDLLERFFREVHRYTPGLQRGETWDHALRSLLEQAKHHVIGIERLILAPAGNGHLLPWNVLLERAGWRTSTGQPLPLVTLPALGVLPRLRQRPRAPTGPTLVVGNPRDDLPFAEAEAKEVAQRFGTRALLRTQATKTAVLSLMAEASLVHLATHAFFDPSDPLDSGIVLADGILTAREILEHRLQADLLVLSACESGQVGSLGGEELAGLSQAFLQAGVRSLLVSLWPVNDPATAALMQAFYDAGEAGADKAQALGQAMTQIQKDPRWSHPYYWGAFVLMGDWD